MARRGPKNLGWDNVLKVQKGTSVAVVLFSKQAHTGKVDRVEPTGIALTTKQGPLLIPAGDIESITTIAKPKMANPGMYMMFGGILLAATSQLVSSVKDVSTLSNGNLPGKHSYALLIAGFAIAAGGVAILVLVGKPRLIYKAVQPPPHAGN
jgi:hypothetical protein